MRVVWVDGVPQWDHTAGFTMTQCVECKIKCVGDPELSDWHKLDEDWFCRGCWARLMGAMSALLGAL